MKRANALQCYEISTVITIYINQVSIQVMPSHLVGQMGRENSYYVLKVSLSQFSWYRYLVLIISFTPTTKNLPRSKHSNFSLTPDLLAMHLSPHHAKLNFDFLLCSCSNTTQVKLTPPILHPQPSQGRRYPWGPPR